MQLRPLYFKKLRGGASIGTVPARDPQTHRAREARASM